MPTEKLSPSNFWIGPVTFVVFAYYKLYAPLVPVSGAELRRARRFGWMATASLLLFLLFLGLIRVVYIGWPAVGGHAP